jgi:spore maturation protein CgeB
MKIIYVGELDTTPDRDSSWINALRMLNNEVIGFPTAPYKTSKKTIISKIFLRLNIGIWNKRLQNDLIYLAKLFKPDLIHFRLPVEFNRKTIKSLRSMNIVVTEFFNDDPFSEKMPIFHYHKFRNALSAFDGHFVWRKKNIQEFMDAGAKFLNHSPPCYDPDWFPNSKEIQLLEPKNFSNDVCYIGHWEDDCRVECLEALLKNGFSVCLKGGMWNEQIKNSALRNLVPVEHAFRDDLVEIYRNSCIGLCFFSKKNNDTWTKRPLEIIASGGVLVCERNKESITYFKDKEEAFFFSSIEELVKIVKLLTSNSTLRSKIQKAGYSRLLKDNHTFLNRASKVLEFVHQQNV